jgi:hypothetical protein
MYYDFTMCVCVCLCVCVDGLVRTSVPEEYLKCVRYGKNDTNAAAALQCNPPDIADTIDCLRAVLCNVT